MADLRELYHEVIVDHGRHPRNFGVLSNANYQKQGFNPLCGDKINLYLYEQEGVIKDVAFEGSGCAISMASASLMTEALKGKNLIEAQQLFDHFHQVVMGKTSCENVNLGKLTILAGVAEYPARVKCATLAWHTLLAAIKNNTNEVTTEEK